MSKEGIYGKYRLSKADRSKMDPQACYFVLRLDTDEHARKAMRAYAKSCGGELGEQITNCLNRLRDGYCNCRSVGECFHDFLGDPVWRHGGSKKKNVG